MPSTLLKGSLLNRMHRFKLFFNHKDLLRTLGLHNTGGETGSFSFTDLLYMCEQFLRDRA